MTHRVGVLGQLAQQVSPDSVSGIVSNQGWHLSGFCFELEALLLKSGKDSDGGKTEAGSL